MLQNTLKLMEEYDMAPGGSLVLCAVSGGSDSMCLLHFLQSQGQSAGFSVIAAHYNHRLRGAESEHDAAFVTDWCKANGIPCVLGAGDVSAQAARQGTGIEETARAMRYDFLIRTAEEAGAARIATAHNADDNVETLLLHLIRGSGLQGLTGIPPRRENIVRPLLTTTRKEIEAYLILRGVPHVEDSSNSDTAFTRNKLRHEVLPVLKQLNPNLTESVSSMIRTLRADHDFLCAQAAERAARALWAGDDLVIASEEIARAPAAIAPRVVRRLLEQMGNGVFRGSSAHLEAVVGLARSGEASATLHLPGGILVQRVYREILFTASVEALPPFEPVAFNRNGETVIPGIPWRVFSRITTAPVIPQKNRDTFYLNCDMISEAALLRPRRTGDAVTLQGRDGKTLKKLFIDAKVPRRVREQIPVLADEGTVLAVAGFGPSESCLARPGEPALEITMAPAKEMGGNGYAGT